jgi:quercetin dioxygenase-like cupin family protein
MSAKVKTFESIGDLRPYAVFKGITARAVRGDRMTFAVVDLEPGAALPEHHHENEQMGLVISGTITMRIGSDKRELHAGDTYVIPSDVPHDAVTGPEGATVVDVFAPIRADWENLARLDPTPGFWP